MKPPICLCPVCKKHPIQQRCLQLRSTCPPRPPKPGPLAGIHAQLINTTSALLADGQNVIFDTVLNQLGTAISYDKATGVFTVAKAGSYLVVWSASVDGSDILPHIRLALTLDGKAVAAPPTPISVGVISGSALVTAAPGAKLALANNTTDIIRLGETPPAANIVISAI